MLCAKIGPAPFPVRAMFTSDIASTVSPWTTILSRWGWWPRDGGGALRRGSKRESASALVWRVAEPPDALWRSWGAWIVVEP